jgi:hypothetical protein
MCEQNVSCLINSHTDFHTLLYNIHQQNAHFLNSYINFCFWCLLHVSNPRVHLQEDGCIHNYGMLCFMCISKSSLLSKTVCSEKALTSWKLIEKMKLWITLVSPLTVKRFLFSTRRKQYKNQIIISHKNEFIS